MMEYQCFQAMYTPKKSYSGGAYMKMLSSNSGSYTSFEYDSNNNALGSFHGSYS